jgi:hypothetical protein
MYACKEKDVSSQRLWIGLTFDGCKMQLAYKIEVPAATLSFVLWISALQSPELGVSVVQVI